MADISGLLIDSSKSSEGVWVEPLGNDVRVRVRSRDDTVVMAEYTQAVTEYRAGALTELCEQWGVKPGTESDDPRFNNMIDGLVTARAVVTDWENVEIRSETIPYSLENAVKLLTSPLSRRIVSRIVAESSQFRPFALDPEGEDAVNLLKAFTGNSSGGTKKSSSGA